MIDTPPLSQAPADSAALRAFAGVALALLVLRIAGLMTSPLELGVDEAQYWSWSRVLDWGYFSKPPMVAWAIAGTTGVFGDAEWAVRLSAPIAHTFGAIALFVLAQRLYGAISAVWTGVLWLTMPGIWLSSAVISTDALMLPLWSAALFAFWRMSERPSLGWAAWLGLAIGFGALSKYAMLYFFLCAGVGALVSPRMRAAVLSWPGALALGVSALVLAPNLIWNAGHEFRTLGHTVANAHLEGALIHPGEMFEFLGSQTGVMGPVLFVTFLVLAGLRLAKRSALSEKDKFLLAFAAPPLLIILVQALMSRANGNWAATAYPAAMVWVVGQLTATKGGGQRTLTSALATHLLLGVIVFAVGVWPSLGNGLPIITDGIKRNRGWAETVRTIGAEARASGAEIIVVDHRALYFELEYYGRDAMLAPVKMWLLNADPRNQAEAEAPLARGDDSRALVAHMAPQYFTLIEGDFAQFARGGAAVIDLGGGERREIQFSTAQGFRPVVRDSAFEAKRQAARAAPAEE